MHACSDTQEKTREGLGVRRSRADGNRRYLGDYRVERETVKAAQETDRWLAGEDAEPTPLQPRSEQITSALLPRDSGSACIVVADPSLLYLLATYTSSISTTYRPARDQKDKMSNAPRDFCEGCNCGRAQEGGLAGPEAAELAAREQRSFTAPVDMTPNEGVEPVVPLRSNMWFNNPEDGESPCFLLPKRKSSSSQTWSDVTPRDI
jgi:hypothetical protein